MQILVLDIAGNPFDWVSPADAAHYYVTGKVAWELGREAIVLRGGTNRFGVQSTLAVKPVIAIAGSEAMTANLRNELPLGDDNRLLWARDRYCCAYCGDVFCPKELTRDHIIPRCRGGADTWTNCASACKACNQAKGAKSVEQFRPLLYVPYVPCRNEWFLLQGRNVLADQMEYLVASLPPHSRLLS